MAHQLSPSEGSVLPPGGPDPLDPGLDLAELLRAQDREVTDLGRLDRQAVEQAAEAARADPESLAGHMAGCIDSWKRAVGAGPGIR